MSKTKIEWCDYTLNPVKGLCPVACPYCYARAMYHRFHKGQEEIYYVGEGHMHAEIIRIKRPSRIFVGSTMELFGEWIKPAWRADILALPALFPQHTFIFLTKRPQNLPKEWPANCWVGVSATNSQMVYDSWPLLEDIRAKVKFYSLEPLQEAIGPDLQDMFELAGISWVIIGQQTPVRPKTTPKVAWVKDIVAAADKAGVRVFLKNNMARVLEDEWNNKSLVARYESGESEFDPMEIYPRQELPDLAR